MKPLLLLLLLRILLLLLLLLFLLPFRGPTDSNAYFLTTGSTPSSHTEHGKHHQTAGEQPHPNSSALMREAGHSSHDAPLSS